MLSVTLTTRRRSGKTEIRNDRAPRVSEISGTGATEFWPELLSKFSGPLKILPDRSLGDSVITPGTPATWFSRELGFSVLGFPGTRSSGNSVFSDNEHKNN